jgi:hypothetical protein
MLIPTALGGKSKKKDHELEVSAAEGSKFEKS